MLRGSHTSATKGKYLLKQFIIPEKDWRSCLFWEKSVLKGFYFLEIRLHRKPLNQFSKEWYTAAPKMTLLGI